MWEKKTEIYSNSLINLASDFDECSLELSPCDPNADCINTDGSYSCTCKQGYTGNGRICEGNYTRNYQ